MPSTRLLSCIRLTVALGLIAFIAACGSDDDDPENATNAGQDSSDGPAEAELRPIKVQMGSAAVIYLDIMAADVAGYFEEAGLDVEYPPTLPNSPAGALAIAQGYTDIGVTGCGGMLAAREAGNDLKAVWAAIENTSNFLVVSPDFAAEMAEQGITPESPLEDRVTALEGRTLATTAAGGINETLLRTMLSDFGVDPDASPDQFVGISDPMAAASAVMRSEITGLFFAPPPSLVPVIEGDGVIWLDGPIEGGEVPSWAGNFNLCHIADASYLSENGDQVQSYVDALSRARTLLADDPESVRDEIREKFFPELRAELYDPAFDAVAPIVAVDPPADPSDFAATLEVFNQTADTPLDEDPSEFTDLSFTEARDS